MNLQLVHDVERQISSAAASDIAQKSPAPGTADQNFFKFIRPFSKAVYL